MIVLCIVLPLSQAEKFQSTSMSVSSILVMPTFALLPEETLAAMLLLAAAPVEVANEGGEYFLSQIAEKKDASNLVSADVVLIPLAMAADALVDAGTYLVDLLMFVRLGGVPQHIMTYGICAGFYGPVSAREWSANKSIAKQIGNPLGFGWLRGNFSA